MANSWLRITAFRVFLRIAVIAAGLSAAESTMSIPPLFDWHLRDQVEPGVDIVPVPHPGHDWPADHPVYHDLYEEVWALQWPLCLMLRDDTGPAKGSTDPNALSTVLGYIPALDFAFAAFEDANREANVLEMVNQVRSYADPDINNARLGNYADFPGAYDESRPFPDQADRSEADEFYLSSGLNVAMPNAYPYEYYEAHTNTFVWDTYVTPNVRAALLWAPLERVSLAKRYLPNDHFLVVWIAGFIPWDGYEADPPTPEDREALVMHLRMRGAQGHYTLISGIDGYSNEEYREDMLQVWHSLDWIYESSPSPNILNLDTDKVSGLQWSGVLFGTTAVFLISNLGNDAASIDLPDISGLPDMSRPVEPGVHQLLTYIVCPTDLDGDSSVGASDLLALLVSWGPCPPKEFCPADFDGNGSVGASDLLALLVNWGPCP